MKEGPLSLPWCHSYAFLTLEGKRDKQINDEAFKWIVDGINHTVFQVINIQSGNFEYLAFCQQSTTHSYASIKF